MRRGFLPVLLLTLLLVSLAACSGSKPASALAGVKANQPAPTAAKASATTAPAAPAKEVTTQAPGNPAADDTLNLNSHDAGLDKLKSYRITWHAKWNPTEDGKTDSANWDWVEEYSAAPKGLHWSWKSISPDQTGKNNAMEMWQIGDTTYITRYDDQGKGKCVSMSNQDQSNQLTKGLFSLGGLGSVSNGKYVGTETVNGVPAKHYKYDENDATLAALSKVSGDIWVAEDGHFVVKDSMNWQGSPGLLGGNTSSKGDGSWTWELSDVNQPIAIKAPEDCGGAIKGLPIMQDATDKTQIGDTVIYKTASKMSDVVAFYQKGMEAASWQAEGEPLVTNEIATLQFSQKNQKANVTITKNNDTTQVMINVKKSDSRRAY